MKRCSFLSVVAVASLVLLAGCKHMSELKGNTINANAVPKKAAAAGQFCEGTYNCTGSGSIYQVGANSRIGFWQVNTCPGNTTLGDNSQWTLVPLSCNCP